MICCSYLLSYTGLLRITVAGLKDEFVYIYHENYPSPPSMTCIYVYVV